MSKTISNSAAPSSRGRDRMKYYLYDMGHYIANVDLHGTAEWNNSGTFNWYWTRSRKNALYFDSKEAWERILIQMNVGRDEFNIISEDELDIKDIIE